jgi:SAM-dependent methyltransferase
VTTPPAGPDIFAGQPGDPALLAAIYDLEHDEITTDLAFYRLLTARDPGPVLDLGCGSGRLFHAFIEGGAPSVTGVDGSPALLERAVQRVAADPLLSDAYRDGRIELVLGDVRRPRVRGSFRAVVLAGVLPHLDGPDGALRMLQAVSPRLDPGGRLVLDDIGPAGLPWRDLPLSLDWERELNGERVVRRSQLTRRETPEGLRVDYVTLTDTVRPDGTIARLPASFRLWYPSQVVLEQLLVMAGFAVELTYGSHDLDPFRETSERRIVIARRTDGKGGRHLPGSSKG